MELCTFFEFAVERHSDKVAVVEKNKRLTYAELGEQVNQVAFSLQKLGLRKQDCVMILLKNRVETVVIYWAVQKLGAIFTPINFQLSKDDIRYCIHDVEPKFVVFEDLSEHLIMKETFKERPIFIGLSDGSQLSDISYRELEEGGVSFYEHVNVGAHDISSIYYTSGTTGVPKGVPRIHLNEYAATMAHIVQCRYQSFDRTLGNYPLYHVIGLRSLQAMTALNGLYVALPDFDSYESLQMIDQEKISCLFLNPTMYHDLVSHPYSNEIDFSAVHTLAYSGAPMSEELITKCDEIMQPDRIVNHYGSTEIYTFTYCSDVRKKPGSSGQPGIHQHIKLITPDPEKRSSSTNVVSTGEIGEIIVNMKSPEAFKGYWNRPNLTKKVIYDGWYYTGDLGFIDQDGDLKVIGRADDMILSGGENIYPELIEKILLEHDKVKEAVIIGEEDERLGQIVVAFIVPNDDSLTFQELDRFCKYHQQLPTYKRPRKYVFVESIPKSPTGKILRSKLRNGQFIELYL
ncbi:class I adenylate-forming enzyme family protein [Halalkalibacter nanhaiisediminis]|uniref:2-furoate---CoA ligase n=1 Tax=Halalkalibacter nanhaiisediminis TaxID=688079 RepID=A0A562QHF2_9BACI|nr:AMP-binding protein [Halalkalibacter nanhaiisediminis]TWI56145.1 2-furoate---CoA ligase [Halalkalibacter nanhaiisediminis]